MKPKFNLEELKRENVYQVPENYFDRLPNRIMQRVTAAPETSGALSWLPAPWRLALAGSGFAAVFATVFMLNFDDAEPNFGRQLAQVNETEIVNYLLASEQLERNDLTFLKVTDNDLTHEFLSADKAEITDVLVDEGNIDETYL